MVIFSFSAKGIPNNTIFFDFSDNPSGIKSIFILFSTPFCNIIYCITADLLPSIEYWIGTPSNSNTHKMEIALSSIISFFIYMLAPIEKVPPWYTNGSFKSNPYFSFPVCSSFTHLYIFAIHATSFSTLALLFCTKFISSLV